MVNRPAESSSEPFKHENDLVVSSPATRLAMHGLGGPWMTHPRACARRGREVRVMPHTLQTLTQRLRYGGPNDKPDGKCGGRASRHATVLQHILPQLPAAIV